jgi:NAD(P)-dependent dehydrogenase (short-subunit alcohol dehydrogenase family)
MRANVVDLSGRVAIVTGAGGGIGREHALLLARLGAKVVVNDLGTDVRGMGSNSTADRVVQEIIAANGAAIADSASVTDPEQVDAMVRAALAKWGRVDILVNNAGVLRDKSFAKMTLSDFRFVLDVHLMGAVHCTKAVWDTMRAQKYGRIVMTTSSTGLYGNFGQSNYGAAKMALIGLMQTLAIEGAKDGIRVNCIAPTAGTRMLEGLLSVEQLALLTPAAVSPAVAVLVGENAPTKTVLCAGAGSFGSAHVTLTRGIHLASSQDITEELASRLSDVVDRSAERVPREGFMQARWELAKANGETSFPAVEDDT